MAVSEVDKAVETHHQEHLDKAFSAIPPSRRFWQHANTPRNLGSCGDANAVATGVGSCGDSITVGLRVKGNTLEKVKCIPEGCVYTVACASAMSVLSAGRNIDDALQLQPEDVVKELEGLPDDHLHCARLAINTLGEAIADYYRREALSRRFNAATSAKKDKGVSRADF